MDKFRWCFIGTGKLAKKVAAEIIKSEKHEIVSCYTRSFDNALEFSKMFNCKAYENAIDAINDKNVDGVYIVTTHNAHFRYAKMALESKKPTLVEKAFTVYGYETEELIKIAKENNTYLLEAMWTWFNKTPNIVKKWVDEGRIGKINKATFTYHMKSINYAPRVSDPKRAGGALLDITVYPITYAYKLFGMPKSIKATGKIENGIDTNEDVILSYDNGLDVNISASIIDMKGLEKMTLIGDKGKIVAPFYHFVEKATLRNGLFKKEEAVEKTNTFSYVPEFDALVKDVNDGKLENDIVPLKQTCDIMHIIDEIAKQINLVYEDLE